jgi:lipopolysaccharide/colanic/teichoic acid biosynthesis glycosyltransferase
LPNLWNLVRGEMKLVGVRPLSEHYYSLYREEVQQARINYQPGLLPPYYADRPSTLEEIQESEMKYLEACDRNGVRRTDWRYFWRIVVG